MPVAFDGASIVTPDGSPVATIKRCVSITALLVFVMSHTSSLSADDVSVMLARRSDVEEFEPLITPSKRIVIVNRTTTQENTILRTSSRERRMILREHEVLDGRLEFLRERRIEQTILEEVGQVIDLRRAKP